MINILSSKLSTSNVNNVLSKNIVTTKIVQGKKNILNREILGDVLISNSNPTTVLKQKFIEKIYIGNVKNGKYCIAFGYNPALGNPNTIDDSNAYLIGLFANKYEGYFLINLYPDVSPKIKTIIPRKEISIALRDSLIEYGRNNPKNDDIYIFAGANFDLMNLQFYYCALYFYNLYVLTDSKNNLKHIATLKHSAVIHRLF